MAKGPQPAGFFALGTAANLMIERRWRDLPDWLLCMIVPLAPAIAWGVAVYQTGVEATWLSYARLTMPPTLYDYIASNSYSAVSLILQMLPATLILPFVVSARRQDRTGHGMMLERAMDGDPAPAYCFGLSTNQLFYVRRPLRCLDEAGQKSLNPPAWLLIPSSTVAPFARLRPDLEVRSVVETGSGPRLAAVRIDKKSGEQ
jgi:hypothetical protein